MRNLLTLRAKLTPLFSQDTAFGLWNPARPSTGHCAAVSALVWTLFGGEMVSATVEDQSHWFNRVGDTDVDLTADQFGDPRKALPVRWAEAGELYQGARVRDFAELKAETLHRAATLGARVLFRYVVDEARS